MVDESTPEAEEPGTVPEGGPVEPGADDAEPVVGDGEPSEPALDTEAPDEATLAVEDGGAVSKLQAESRALREEAERLHEHAEARQRAATELREEAARLREEAEKLLAQPEELAAEVARLREQTEAAAALFEASSEGDGQPEAGVEAEPGETEEWVEEPGRQPFATPSGPPPGEGGDTEEQDAVRRRSWLRRR